RHLGLEMGRLARPRDALAICTLAAGSILAASCGSIGAASGAPQATPPPIPLAVLASNGIMLTVPPNGPVAISQAHADAVALQQFIGGSKVLSTELMSVSQPPLRHRVCWVVSVHPVGDQ
ncbi:MAG: hypothetical protein ACRDRT_03220, partial [Pseudonocardiaceae bacterium]